MTLLGIKGPTERDLAAEETTESRIRAEAAKKLSLGGGISIGAVISFGLFEVVRSDPKEVFPLLQSWGPRVILAIIVIYVVYDLVKMAINVAVRLVHALEKLAVAQQQSADKDDRQLQEMQTLSSLTAQRSERVYDQQRQYHDENQEMFRRIEDRNIEEHRRLRHDLKGWQDEVRNELFLRGYTRLAPAATAEGEKGTT